MSVQELKSPSLPAFPSEGDWVLHGGLHHCSITCVFMTSLELQLPSSEASFAVAWQQEGAALCGALPYCCVWEVAI